MSKVEDFLSPEEEQEIISAIKTAEKNTSGEIRVHLEATTDLDHVDRALDVFEELEMHNTKLKNGVLIYIAVEDRNFVIFGDKGINDVVADTFWDSTKNLMQSHFKAGSFKDGIVAGILEAGQQLKKHFPWSSDDINELPDTISKG